MIAIPRSSFAAPLQPYRRDSAGPASAVDVNLSLPAALWIATLFGLRVL
jgi:hypothetical protein